MKNSEETLKHKLDAIEQFKKDSGILQGKDKEVWAELREIKSIKKYICIQSKNLFSLSLNPYLLKN